MTPVSPTSIKVEFVTPHQLDHFPPGLKTDIRYRSEFDDDEWTSFDTRSMEHLSPSGKVCHGRECEEEQKKYGKIEVELDNLLPYAKYTVEIKLLSATADINDHRMWSDPMLHTNRTLPTIPGKPPETVRGSFEVAKISETNMNLFAYWRNIDKSSENGPGFRYKVAEMLRDGKSIPVHDHDVKSSYAQFKGLSSSSSYTIIVTSENNVGTATESSRLFIPSSSIRNFHTMSPTKIAYNKTFYEISWLKPGNNDHQVESYTVFWCVDEGGRARPYQCDGSLMWKEVAGSDSSVNISSSELTSQTQFAVSANVGTGPERVRRKRSQAPPDRSQIQIPDTRHQIQCMSRIPLQLIHYKTTAMM